MSSLRVALIGYGNGGRYYSAPLIAAVPDLDLAAVVTTNPQRAAQARADHPGVAVLAPDELAGAGLDLAVVSTPPATHEALAGRALDAGLHVVVDKPLAPTAAAAARLVEQARSCGRILTVYQNRRYDSATRTAARVIEQGRIGRPVAAELRFERWRPATRGGWREAAGDGGGILLDLGSHLVDSARVLFGSPELLGADVRAARSAGMEASAGAQPGDVGDVGDDLADDVATLLLRHPGGVTTTVVLSLLAADNAPVLRVAGTAGTLVIGWPDPQEADLRDGRVPDGTAWGMPPRELWPMLHAPGPDAVPVAMAVEPEPGDWRLFWSALAAAVRGQGPVPVDPADAVATLVLLEQARGSRTA